jgi:hypothetical protein
MSRVIQNISNSIRIAKLPKQKSYGHYCNLCKKYGYDRLKSQEFQSPDIMAMEYKYLNDKRSKQARNIANLACAYLT